MLPCEKFIARYNTTRRTPLLHEAMKRPLRRFVLLGDRDGGGEGGEGGGGINELNVRVRVRFPYIFFVFVACDSAI